MQIMKSSKPYIKYTYWLTQEEETSLRERLSGQGIRLKSAKGVTCTPLDELNKIASVDPAVWDAHCARAGTWYKSSDKKGRYLIVSSFELKGYEKQGATVIRPSDFTPQRELNHKEKEELAHMPEFSDRMPPGWQDVKEKEKRIYLRWAAKLGSSVRDFDILLLSQSANHANFIRPRFFVEKNGLRVPYSIDHSSHLCSCCLEFYDVLGDDYRQKLVRPCPGAVFYARLEADQYFLVDKLCQ
jgi:hypothetical protein